MQLRVFRAVAVIGAQHRWLPCHRVASSLTSTNVSKATSTWIPAEEIRCHPNAAAARQAIKAMLPAAYMNSPAILHSSEILEAKPLTVSVAVLASSWCILRASADKTQIARAWQNKLVPGSQ